MGARPLTVTREQLRQELAADLGRGGYVLSASAPEKEGRYFDKSLVLSRPGLLNRAARLMADLLPSTCERLAVTGVQSSALGTALAQETGVPLLFGRGGDKGSVEFQGELYRGVKAVLIEDVVFSGRSAVRGIEGLQKLGAEVDCALCLLDRDIGGAQRIAEAGVNLRSLFEENDLLTSSHGKGA
jgi:orotate phosphoribosyltransferase